MAERLEHPNGCGCMVCGRRRELLASSPRARELEAAHDPAYEHAPPPDPEPAAEPADPEPADPEVVEVHHHHHEHTERVRERDVHHHAKPAPAGHHKCAPRRHRHRKRSLLRTVAVGVLLVWLLNSMYPELNVPLVPGISCAPAPGGQVQAAAYQDAGLDDFARDTVGTIVRKVAVSAAESALHQVGETVRAMAVSPPSMANMRAGLSESFGDVGRVVGFVVGGLMGRPVAERVLAEGAAVGPGCGACPRAAVPAGNAPAGALTAARAAVAAGWTGSDAVVAVAVAGAESGWDPRAENPSSSAKGLWQTMMSYHAPKFAGAAWSDPMANGRVAHRIWRDAGGWGPWVAHTSGAYRQHLPAARAAVARVQASRSPSSSNIVPSGPVEVDGWRISAVTARQLRLAEQAAGVDLRIMQGGYGGGDVAASGTSHDYPGVVDISPGSIAVEQLLRRHGFAAWARNVPGRSTAGDGAHVHAVSLLDPGNKRHPQVYGSWANHGNGLSGYNNDPAPHVAWVPGLAEKVNGVNLDQAAAQVVECTPPPAGRDDSGGVLQASYGTSAAGFKVATLNVLGASHKRGGPADWRMGKSVQLLDRHRVDVVGLQEFQGVQKPMFVRSSRGAFGLHHAAGNTENAIGWRTDTMRLVEGRSFEVPYFGGRPKPMTYVKLQHRASGEQVWVVNVHNPADTRLHPRQGRWRAAAVAVEQRLVDRLEATGTPVLLVGDFNARPRFAGMEASGPSRIDWLFGSGLRFTGHTVDDGALADQATDHPIVVAQVGL